MTRSLMIKPKNGGEACDTTEYTEACNTMSCDRDCTLADWTSWTPCSVACGGGMQSRAKHVVVPIRGYGKCPKESSWQRYGDRSCNTQDCVGDEICIAHQDLVIAIDGSGSLKPDQFNSLKNYALDLITRYRSAYFGGDAMKVGVVGFGNGYIEDDEVTISPAINLRPLTTDLDTVKTAISDYAHQKGFTNMAQAFALAETMYTTGGREGAQPALLVITDGTPSFQFQTNELVQQLDDKGVQRFFVVVTEDDKALERRLRKTIARNGHRSKLADCFTFVSRGMLGDRKELCWAVLEPDSGSLNLWESPPREDWEQLGPFGRDEWASFSQSNSMTRVRSSRQASVQHPKAPFKTFNLETLRNVDRNPHFRSIFLTFKGHGGCSLEAQNEDTFEEWINILENYDVFGPRSSPKGSLPSLNSKMTATGDSPPKSEDSSKHAQFGGDE